ncbi:TRAP transporter permease [Chloroflexota bacterium]
MTEEHPLKKYRQLDRFWNAVAIIFPITSFGLILIFVFHFRPFGYVLVDVTYLYLLLALFLPLTFIWIPISAKARHDKVSWYDTLLALASILIPVYFALHESEIRVQGWSVAAPPLALAFSFILWLLVLEAGRRAAGPVFAIIVVFFSAYPLFASHLPGILMAPSFTLSQVTSFHALSDESIMGIPMHIFGGLVIGYMVLATTLQAVGAGQFFTDLAAILLKNTRARNAKIAILGSSFFSMISGSGVANVYVTGSFTIPAMKNEGIPSEFAAGVEASASAGGMLMPPIMGAAAFIMAEFLEISYAVVCITAAVPSILYYVCLFTQIDCFAGRKGFKATPADDQLDLKTVLLKNLPIVASFLLLIYMLFYLRLTSWAPWYATAVAVAGAFFRKEIRSNIKDFLTKLTRDAGRILSELIAILAPVGLVIGSFVVTGVAYSFPHAVVGATGGNLYLLLLLGFAASFILGMGVPMVPCYVFLAIVLIPGLVEGGINELAAHLFVMYCAVLSAITPPVALNAFAAASIAGCSPMKAGFQAMKLGIAKYILPFVFVLNPALVLQGPITEILRVIPTALVGLIVISAGLEGYLWRTGNLSLLGRLLLFTSGILLAFPTANTDIIGIICVAAFCLISLLLRGKNNPLVILTTGEK